MVRKPVMVNVKMPARPKAGDNSIMEGGNIQLSVSDVTAIPNQQVTAGTKKASRLNRDAYII
jgi:hypothetical protein